MYLFSIPDLNFSNLKWHLLCHISLEQEYRLAWLACLLCLDELSSRLQALGKTLPQHHLGFGQNLVFCGCKTETFASSWTANRRLLNTNLIPYLMITLFFQSSRGFVFMENLCIPWFWPQLIRADPLKNLNITFSTYLEPYICRICSSTICSSIWLNEWKYLCVQ